MQVTLTPEDLIKFEDDVCELWANKKIRSPIHLDSGNERQLIKVFETLVDKEDFCLGTWRMHYRALLKGVPPDELKQEILVGHSIGLCFPEYKVISSAIVGGIIPIALGVALGIKRQGGTNKAVCFVGDMSSETGAFHEAVKYAFGHQLPIVFVVEDNKKSVCTPTLPTWGLKKLTYAPEFLSGDPYAVYEINEKVTYYSYESKYQHAGGLDRIQF